MPQPSIFRRRWEFPACSTRRTVLYLHGGGFCMHLPGTYLRIARKFADALDETVVLPNYRLAPEHRYPAAPDDCLAVYRALLDAGHEARRMTFAGDSAGGNLTLVTLLRSRDERLSLPACAVLISRGADLATSGASVRANEHADPVVPVSVLPRMISHYVDSTLLDHPYVSPMRADYTGLPPLCILVGSTEVLLDSARGVAESAQRCGLEVDLQVWDRMPHVFPLLGFLPEARAAFVEMVTFISSRTR